MQQFKYRSLGGQTIRQTQLRLRFELLESRIMFVAEIGDVLSPWLVPSPESSFTQSIVQRESNLIDAHSNFAVHIGYLIPSNRAPQPDAVANLQRSVPLWQNWYRQQMERNGFGSKTFQFETEQDLVTPRVHVVNIPNVDSYYRADDSNNDGLVIYNRTIAAANGAGLGIFSDGTVWLLINECHLQLTDGSVKGGVALGAGYGSGNGGGVGVMGSDVIPFLNPDLMNDNRNYHGLVFPGLGPYPMKQDISRPWFEGNTVSSISSSNSGAALHELSHGFGLPHNLLNDENFSGNLMGNGLRGFRGEIYPQSYPSDEMRSAYGSSLALNTSRFFNPNLTITDNTAPTINTVTSGVVIPVSGLVEIQFAVQDNVGVASAILLLDGNVVEESALTGTNISSVLKTDQYTPGTTQNFTLVVFDAQGNRSTRDFSITAATGFNRAPQPFVKIARAKAGIGEVVTFDASRTSDPDGSTFGLLYEWDFNNDGIYDTPSSSTSIVTRSFVSAGSQLVRVRVTDPIGAVSLSDPIGYTIIAALVVNRQVFYNRSPSSVFGNGSGNPTTAIDTLKVPLLPGQTTSFSNYTNYVHGLNGLVVDIADLRSTLSIADFQFDVWNGIDANGFIPTTNVPTIFAIDGGGISGSSRVKIEFNNATIKNTWLRITVLANANTGLANNDVFYFGNAIGDTNAGNIGSPVTVRTNATDTSIVRQNQSISPNSVGVTSIHDLNKDGRVNATDTSIVRQNQLNSIIRFFNAPASLQLAVARSSLISSDLLSVPMSDFVSRQTSVTTAIDPVVAQTREEKKHLSTHASTSMNFVLERWFVEDDSLKTSAPSVEIKRLNSSLSEKLIDRYFAHVGKDRDG